MHRRITLVSRRRVIEVVGRHRVCRTRAWQCFEQVVCDQRRARTRRLDYAGIGSMIRDTAIIVVVWKEEPCERTVLRFAADREHGAPIIATISALFQIARGTLWSTRAIPLIRCQRSLGWEAERQRARPSRCDNRTAKLTLIGSSSMAVGVQI